MRPKHLVFGTHPCNQDTAGENGTVVSGQHEVAPASPAEIAGICVSRRKYLKSRQMYTHFLFLKTIHFSCRGLPHVVRLIGLFKPSSRLPILNNLFKTQRDLRIWF